LSLNRLLKLNAEYANNFSNLNGEGLNKESAKNADKKGTAAKNSARELPACFLFFVVAVSSSSFAVN
jgi:hypothetical protein